MGNVVKKGLVRLLTCLIGMALPLPMLSVLLSTLFACSLAFRDCKETRKSVRHRSDAQSTRWEPWGYEENFGGVVRVGACVREGKRLGVRGCLEHLL